MKQLGITTAIIPKHFLNNCSRKHIQASFYNAFGLIKHNTWNPYSNSMWCHRLGLILACSICCRFSMQDQAIVSIWRIHIRNSAMANHHKITTI